MIALDAQLVLQANAATGATPVAQVVARTVSQQTKNTYEDYQRRTTRTVLTGATPITICAAPDVNHFKAVEYVGIVNTDSTTRIITVSTYDGTTRYPLIIQSLDPNEGLYYEHDRGWYVLEPDCGGGGEAVTQITLGGTFDGGGAEPTTDTVFYVVSQWAGTLLRWDIVADQVGSAVVDVWKAAAAIPTIADAIAGTEKPTLSSAQLASLSPLADWDTAVLEGDVFGFSLDSATTVTRVTVELKIGV